MKKSMFVATSIVSLVGRLRSATGLVRVVCFGERFGGSKRFRCCAGVARKIHFGAFFVCHNYSNSTVR